MEERKVNFWRMIRRNSIFSRIFYGLLLLSFFVLTVFYISINILNARHQREQLANSRLNLISQAASSMDITLDGLAQSMSQVLWNRDFIDYMINPDSEDRSLLYRMSQQLHNTVTGSRLVNKAVFFSTLSDVIMQDTSQLDTRDAFADRVLMEACGRSAPTVFDGQSRTSTAIVYYKNRLFLIQELNIASPIGTLIYELNLDALQKQFFQLSGEKSDILVFDAQGTPIFDRTDLNINWNNPQLFLTYEDAPGRAAIQISGYYRYTAHSSGWNFLLPIDQAREMLPIGRVLTLYCPAFMVIFLCSLLFAWYISQTTYRPIHNLMQLVSKPGTERAPKLNELDFLESAYFNAMEGRAQLEVMINSIAPEIIESMLKNLINGRNLSKARLQEILAGVGNPFRVQGRFLVIACVMEPPKDREVNDTELNLHLLAIRNLLNDLPAQAYRVYDIRTEKLTVALVCCFSENQLMGTITQEYRRIKRMLQYNTELLPFRLRCECGNIYQDLGDIRHSYREAVEKVQYMQYMQSSESEPEVEAEHAAALEMNQQYFQEKAKEIVKLTAENLWPQAQAVLMRVLDEIGDRASDLENYKALIQRLMDETMERVIVYPLTKEDQAALNRCRMRLENAGLSKEQDVVEAVQGDYQMIFQMIAAYSRKSRYKYIETAKAYIADNYMDSNLSLNKVSDYIGISASYLSELFNEIANEKFSSYLAAFRVEKARQLFHATKLTSKDIGFRCGFNSVQNFIRVFKKYTGRTPGQYREEIYGNED